MNSKMLLKKLESSVTPEEGDYRIDQHFAWWPTVIDDKLVWLESYKRVYQYRLRDRHVILAGKCFEFKNAGGWDLIATQRIKK